MGWDRPLPLEPGDRGVLRNPGRHSVAAGVIVRDVDPPPLAARGAARGRSLELAATALRDDAAPAALSAAAASCAGTGSSSSVS